MAEHKTEVIGFRATPELAKRMTKAAKKEGMTRSELMRWACNYSLFLSDNDLLEVIMTKEDQDYDRH